MPSPTPFVVKNGSKIRPATTGVIRNPRLRRRGRRIARLELARIVGETSALLVRIVSVPPVGMASRAFRARLSSTCCIWPGSAGPNRAGARARSPTRSALRGHGAASRRSRRPARSARAAATEGSGAAEASSCPVSVAARCALASTLRGTRRCGAFAVDLRLRELRVAEHAEEKVEVMRDSAVSGPIASIFCDWRSSSSAARRCVMFWPSNGARRFPWRPEERRRRVDPDDVAGLRVEAVLVTVRVVLALEHCREEPGHLWGVLGTVYSTGSARELLSAPAADVAHDRVRLPKRPPNVTSRSDRAHSKMVSKRASAWICSRRASRRPPRSRPRRGSPTARACRDPRQ